MCEAHGNGWWCAPQRCWLFRRLVSAAQGSWRAPALPLCTVLWTCIAMQHGWSRGSPNRLSAGQDKWGNLAPMCRGRLVHCLAGVATNHLDICVRWGRRPSATCGGGAHGPNITDAGRLRVEYSPLRLLRTLPDAVAWRRACRLPRKVVSLMPPPPAPVPVCLWTLSFGMSFRLCRRS